MEYDPFVDLLHLSIKNAQFDMVEYLKRQINKYVTNVNEKKKK